MALLVPKMLILGFVLLLLAMVEGTPPGIAKEPKKVKCNDPKFKECSNLEHVCPMFCPDTCTVDCGSCKPICGASAPSPSPSSSSGQKIVWCKNKKYSCFGQEHVCPANCPTTCEVDCVICKPVCKCDYPGAVCQDPRFIGGDGITFYFHGKKEHNFCLLTDTNLHINAHFIGKRSPNMTRDFTWVQSLGILFDNHRLFIGAKKTSKWDDSNDRLALTFDNKPIFLRKIEGTTWHSTTTPRLSIVGNVIQT